MDLAREAMAMEKAIRPKLGGLAVTYLSACGDALQPVRFHYSSWRLTGISEPLPATNLRLGRRTVLTFPLLPPPQKN
jgi:hypothetical protein